MNTAQRLKYIRKKTGLSQKKFAEVLEEKFTRINSIEAGKQVNFPYNLAEKILEKFEEENYNFKWITTGEGEPCSNQFITAEEKEDLGRAEKILDKLVENVTDSEFDLVAECLMEKKEVTIWLLKKLKDDEMAVKKFLLEEESRV